jgi:hypothetical protein
MIYVALLSAAFLAPCVPALFSHKYQEIGDDVTLCTFYSIFFFYLFQLGWLAVLCHLAGEGCDILPC